MATPIVTSASARVQSPPRFRTTLYTFGKNEPRALLLLGLTVHQARAGKQVFDLALGDCLRVVIVREGRNEYGLWVVNRPQGKLTSESLKQIAFGGLVTYLVDAATDQNNFWMKLVSISQLCGVPRK